MPLNQISGLSANFVATMLYFDQPPVPLVEYLRLSEPEMQRQLATLRHCELVKGHKEHDKVYLVPFS